MFGVLSVRKTSLNLLRQNKPKEGEMTGTITELQNDYARHCGYDSFEELRENNEEALRIWYLKMFELKGEIT